jgi:hypothetical protein
MNDQAHRFADAAMAAFGRGPLTDAEVRVEMDQPCCRWCRAPVIHRLPCTCERAQRELASIRAGTER